MSESNIQPGLSFRPRLFDPNAPKKFKFLVWAFILVGILLAFVFASLEQNHLAIASASLGFAGGVLGYGLRGILYKQDLLSLGRAASPNIYVTGNKAFALGVIQCFIALLIVIFAILVIASPSFDSYLQSQVKQTHRQN